MKVTSIGENIINSCLRVLYSTTQKANNTTRLKYLERTAQARGFKLDGIIHISCIEYDFEFTHNFVSVMHKHHYLDIPGDMYPEIKKFQENLIEFDKECNIVKRYLTRLVNIAENKADMLELLPITLSAKIKLKSNNETSLLTNEVAQFHIEEKENIDLINQRLLLNLLLDE